MSQLQSSFSKDPDKYYAFIRDFTLELYQADRSLALSTVAYFPREDRIRTLERHILNDWVTTEPEALFGNFFKAADENLSVNASQLYQLASIFSNERVEQFDDYIKWISELDQKAEGTGENLWTPRRELVYRKETLADLAQKAKESGETPTEVVLPGFSGNEYKVAALEFESEINEEGITEGSIKGHLTADPDSQVIIGYYGQRESGVISSPHLEQDISYDPREDGQVMVKSVDLKALDFAFGDAHCSSIYGAHEVGEPNGEL